MSAIAVERQGLGTAPTVTRLMIALVRRNRGAFLVWAWMIPMTTRMLAQNGARVGWIMGASMALAFLLGIQTGEGVGCREHRVLPVTNRDLWVTRWLNATFVVPLFLLILKSVGAALAATDGKTFIPVETLLLSTLFDVVYAGALMPVPLWLEVNAGPIARRLGRPGFLVSLMLVLIPPLTLMGIGGPLLFARDLPTRISEFSTTSALVMVIGLTMLVAGLRWTPRHGGAPLLFRRATSPAVPAQSGKPKLGDGLTGVLFVIWTHIKATFVLAAVGIGATIAASPLVPRPDPHAPRFLAGMFLVFAFMGISMSSVWASRARGLKVLPLSVTQVNALFVFTPIVTWVEIWLMLLAVHVALGLPIHEELGPLAILMYAGFSALTHALGLRLSGSSAGQSAASMAGVIAAGGIAMVLFKHQDLWTRLLLVLTALLSLALSALINHYTLTRLTSSALTYRRPGMSVRP